ncbi:MULTISPECIES: DUF2956 domain-containing protein [Shewanella]|uniref:DUF2956 domain-containing protein n=1 Tax=Shewanella fidelis TaxID=173509 RepID=A0AAW8NHH9_9GAMM|nr:MULTISPECIES: DUF2956 domain-containing protein [Shewanella]MDR8522613.1 DUF2956 domain-containing protein [Shewanella fidelis]MDW4812229.1 DUF2956 domain-containing protein [Shewanella fidelis]MDW4816107.1 DUF2956 domain-containing protein [Shewanella fidelis]MDW4820470.1 DUF2956 domain-containing protein [Shewanella fidelis]MDW4824692.1 DUF2956 domain-containing protein [Shewanella fidelis]
MATRSNKKVATQSAAAKQSISDETKAEAMKMAKATQKPNQTKEQTKLIAQGIEKGIAEYKKLQKGKARERDKARKQESKAKAREANIAAQDHRNIEERASSPYLPWGLLTLSWIGFITYILVSK